MLAPQLPHHRTETVGSSRVLADAVRAMAHDHERAVLHCGKGREEVPSPSRRLVVEVPPCAGEDHVLGGLSACRQILGRSENARELVSLTADRLVNERVGRPETPAQSSARLQEGRASGGPGAGAARDLAWSWLQ